MSELTAQRGRMDRWFFVAVASLFVVTVAVGFAPTFYLRGLGTEGLPPGLRHLPVSLYVHGVVLTAWFLLYFVQTVLVATDRKDVHRRLGVASVFVGVALIVTTWIALQQALAGRIRPPLPPVVFFINVSALVQFAVCLVFAIRFRRRPEVHKRLMYIAIVPLMGAAVSRIPGATLPIIAALAPGLLLVLIVRDLVVNRRVHPVTIWGGIVLTFGLLGISAAVGQSALGRAIVQALT